MRAIEKKFFGQICEGENGCLVWTGRKHEKGYGLLYHGGRDYRAHRLSWMIAHGEEPELDVLHTCDNPACVNPDHLFLGTNIENNEDKVAKDRQAKGEQQAAAILTDEAVLEIRRRGAAGTHTYAELSQEYGVAEKTIRKAMSGEAWKHLPNATPNRAHKKAAPDAARFELRGERLTIGEIAKKYGVVPQTVRLRVKKGLRGEHLIAPAMQVPRQPYRRFTMADVEE